MINKKKEEAFPVENLKKWFEEDRRELPWRKSKNPYAVLVSEFMLQQTTVPVVIPYFSKWMKIFPSFELLAKASINDVLKIWEGLGYYSRARALHLIAQRVCNDFHGVLPGDPEVLMTFKGIGQYTANAVALFAFGKKVAPVDGNVLRVMSRFWGIMASIDSVKVQKHIQQQVTAILPDDGFQQLGEGLIELGALVCRKKPVCEKCPLNSGCKAYRDSLQYLLPLRKERKKQILLYRMVMVLKKDREVFLIKRKPGEIMEGLYEFPYLELDLNTFSKKQSYEQYAKDFLSMPVRYKKHLQRQHHCFTYYKAFLQPIVFEIDKDLEGLECERVAIEDLSSKVFSSGHRKIVKELLEDKELMHHCPPKVMVRGI